MQHSDMENTRISQLIKKCQDSGFNQLSQKEAAELFLSYAAFLPDARDMQEQLGGDTPFSFFELSDESLTDLNVGYAARFLIEKFPEIANRCLPTRNFKSYSPKYSKSAQQEAILKEIILNKFMGISTEKVLLVFFNEERKISYIDFMTAGDNNSAIIDTSEICTRASKAGACFAVLAHNHPSGMTVPSKSDCESTIQLFDALEQIGVILLEHYIVTRTECTSIRKYFDFYDDDPIHIKLAISKLGKS